MSYSHREVFLGLFTPVREAPSKLLDSCSGPVTVQTPPVLQDSQSHLRYRIGQCKSNVTLWAQTGEFKRGERGKGEEKRKAEPLIATMEKLRERTGMKVCCRTIKPLSPIVCEF